MFDAKAIDETALVLSLMPDDVRAALKIARRYESIRQRQKNERATRRKESDAQRRLEEAIAAHPERCFCVETTGRQWDEIHDPDNDKVLRTFLRNSWSPIYPNPMRPYLDNVYLCSVCGKEYEIPAPGMA